MRSRAFPEFYVSFVTFFRYLNTQYIKKQKFSDADINYGGFGVELNEQMLEIGEVESGRNSS